MHQHFFAVILALSEQILSLCGCSAAVTTENWLGADASSWTMAGEFEPVDEVFLGWDDELEDFYRDVLVGLAGHARISLLVDSEYDRRRVERLIFEVEESRPHQLRSHKTRIAIVDIDVESVWLRDFGPLLVRSDDHREGIIDLRYWREGDDDEVASELARSWLGLDTFQVELELEGGNIQADGAGNCLLSTAVLGVNQGLGEERIRTTLRRSLGCRNIDFLPPLPGEPTEHVDMYLVFTGPAELIVGRYGPDDAHEAKELLDWIAFYLEERGFKVRRVPMPEQHGGRFRTYTNALAVNGVVLVPYYEDAQRGLEETLEVYRAAYPGRQIIAVDSTAIIELDGAVHCAAITTPR